MALLYWALFCIFQYVYTLPNTVETNFGKIKGTVFYYEGKEVQAFLGIPFAEPPIGNLRFRKPEPVKPINDTLLATQFPPACLQQYPVNHPWVDNMSPHSEDCLYLNVWVPPNTSRKSKKAVMFWLFSGSFRFGSNRLPTYDGQVLSAEGDVIVVTINYRIGIHGFLVSPTKSENAPGNAGLLDMVEALKWVKQNIKSFGGDSDSVTIFGQSSGSEAVGMLCISPLSKGLFKRAILQAGSAAYDGIDYTQQNIELGQKVAEAVGCGEDFRTNPNDTIQCLRTKDAELLLEVAESLTEGFYGFYSVTGDEFLPVDPKFALNTGNFHDVDIMVGHNQDEGSVVLVLFDIERFGYFGEKDPKMNKTVGKEYIRELFKDRQDKELVVQYYLGKLNEYDYDAVLKQVYDSFGDLITICPDTYFADSYAKFGKNVYFYYFNHVPSVTPWAPWMGSVHFDEVPFVYGRPLERSSNYTTKEGSLSGRMIKIWTNFAKKGYPSRRWRKYSKVDSYIKELNISKRKSYLNLHKRNCEFLKPFSGFY